ncbi:DUF4097 family beta strand repeat-containing protein [Streptococcus dentasini]
MKKWKKLLLAIGIVASLLGLILTFVGFYTGGISGIQQKYQGERSFVKKKLTNFDTINLEATNPNYQFLVKTTDDKQPSITYYKYKKQPIKTKVNNNELTVTAGSPNSRITIEMFNLEVLGELIDRNDRDTVVISLPKGTNIRELKSSLNVNDLKLDELTIDKADVKMATGDLSLDRTTINKGHIDLISGDMVTSNAHLSDLAVSIDTGDLSLDKTNIKKGSLKLITGDMNISNTSLSDLSLSIDTGDIELDSVILNSLSIDTSTGDVEGDGLTFRKNNKISVDTGDISLALSDYQLNVSSQTDTGDEELTHKLIHSNTNFLDISSNTGDVEIE